MKIFRSEDEEMFIHAEREFRIMQKLSGHPNIVRGIEYLGEIERSKGYIIMEKIVGKSILSMIESTDPLGEIINALSEAVTKNLMR